MKAGPLSEKELNFVDEQLLSYGGDDGILNVAELDGFLTAIVSGPDMIPPNQWLAELWGGANKMPNWPDEETAQRFTRIGVRPRVRPVVPLAPPEHPEKQGSTLFSLILTMHQGTDTMLIVQR